jgi:hypothetical protein
LRRRSRTPRRHFARELPRLFELRASSPNPEHPDAYFTNFEHTLEMPTAFPQFRELEDTLDSLDAAGWESVKRRAIPHLISTTRANGRGWQQLFDVFHEARAFRYLQSDGCTGIRFIEVGRTRRPDLAALKNGQPLFCEVKSLHVSKDEADRRVQIAQAGFAASSSTTVLASGFLNKLSSTLHSAVAQLDGADPHRGAARLIYVVVDFDDWVGHYQPQYFAQMDAFLSVSPLGDASLAFHPARNLFERALSMKNALVV